MKENMRVTEVGCVNVVRKQPVCTNLEMYNINEHRDLPGHFSPN